MVLEIKTTGVEQYLPGGEANMKLLVVGGPGVGKTRWSSYWPDPIYANIEAGLASVADRQVPYADISNSADLLQFLKYLAEMCKKPKIDRKFQTVVIDTLDAFQRKVKDEWLQANPSYASFSGFDAWGYLDAKMQMLMTRLLNLDMNVLVLVHYKDKVVTEGRGENKTETHQLMLQLQGDIKDSAFNDFDLVGWMDTYWKPGPDNSRIQARGITFKPTPDRPFLKDRLHVTPEWLEVQFDDTDYTRLFERFMSRVDGLKEGKVVGVIDVPPDEHAIAGEGVTGPLGGGPLPPQDPKDMPLSQLNKPDLIALARTYPSIADQVKTNTLKAELIAMIEKARAEGPTAEEQAAAEGQAAETPGAEPTAAPEATAAPAAPAEAPAPAAAPAAPAPTTEEVKPPPQQTPEAPASSPEPAPTPSTPVQPETAAHPTTGEPVDTTTGEILTPEQVAKELGAEVISDEADAESAEDTGPPAALESAPQPPAQEQAAAAPAAEAQATTKTCAECGKDLAGENQDYVKLSWIKFRKLLCNEHYIEAKKG